MTTTLSIPMDAQTHTHSVAELLTDLTIGQGRHTAMPKTRNKAGH